MNSFNYHNNPKAHIIITIPIYVWANEKHRTVGYSVKLVRERGFKARCSKSTVSHCTIQPPYKMRKQDQGEGDLWKFSQKGSGWVVIWVQDLSKVSLIQFWSNHQQKPEKSFTWNSSLAETSFVSLFSSQKMAREWHAKWLEFEPGGLDLLGDLGWITLHLRTPVFPAC